MTKPHKSKPRFPRPRPWPMLVEAVEEGTAYAVSRLWKYASVPRGWTEADEERLRDLIRENVLTSIAEAFRF